MYTALVIYFKYNLEMPGDTGKEIHVFYKPQCMHLEIHEHDKSKVEIETFSIIKAS